MVSSLLSKSISLALIASFALPSFAVAYDGQAYAKNTAQYSAEYQTANTALENRMNDRFAKLSSAQQSKFLASVKNLLKKRVAKIERQSEEKFQRRTARKLRFIQRIVAKKSVDNLNLEQDEAYSPSEKQDSDSALGTIAYLVGSSSASVSTPTSEASSIQMTKTEFLEQARAAIDHIENNERRELPDYIASEGDLFTLKLIVILLFIAIPVILLVIAILTSALGWWIAAGLYIGLLAVIYFTSGDKRRQTPEYLEPGVAI